MKERPISFNSPMVRAILDRTKTQTRRVIKPQPQTDGLEGVYGDLYNGGPTWGFWLPDNRMTESRVWKCPQGVPGDVLWVKETFFCATGSVKGGPALYHYRADAPADLQAVAKESGLWRSSRYMPKEACRLRLRVEDVRVERVQDICSNGLDAIAEGWPHHLAQFPTVNPRSKALVWFMEIWDSINGKRGYGWATNPWVWVITFSRLETPDAD